MVLFHILLSLAVLGTLLFLVLRWLSECGVGLPAVFQGHVASVGTAPKRKELFLVFGAALLFRLLSLGVTWIFSWLQAEGGPVTLQDMFIRWDARHYLALTEQGYAGYQEDGAHLFLVFFPLYVWVVRFVALILQNTLLSGLLVSWLAFAGGCCYVYCLAFARFGRSAAIRTICYLSLFPFAFFFGGVMTEGLYLLTCGAALYAIYRHKWLTAGLWGMLAALTRMHGLLLVIPAVAELLRSYAPVVEGKLSKERCAAVAKRLPLPFLPCLGTAGYLALNWYVDGNPFAFLIHQQHWYQGGMWISKVIAYMGQYAWSTKDAPEKRVLWIPQLLLFVLFFLLLWRGIVGRRQGSHLLLYAFVSFVMTFSLSWLLSAGRYLSTCIPFFLFAAEAVEGKPLLRIGIPIFCAAGYGWLLWMHLAGASVM